MNAPKMEYQRQAHILQGPEQKIRKIVHLSPEVEQLLKTGERPPNAQLYVRHEGDEVFVSIRVVDPQIEVLAEPVPREPKPRPQRPPGS